MQGYCYPVAKVWHACQHYFFDPSLAKVARSDPIQCEASGKSFWILIETLEHEDNLAPAAWRQSGWLAYDHLAERNLTAMIRLTFLPRWPCHTVVNM